MKQNIYDLTNPQKSIILTEEFYKGSPLNNICGTAIINENVDFSLLEKSILTVLNTNDIFKLNFVFENDIVKQTLSNSINNNITYFSINSSSELEEIRKSIVTKPFNLSNSYLYDFYIFKMPESQGAFMLNIHHVLADSWTLAFVCNEIIRIYSCLKQGNVPEKISHSYIDYIYSEQKYLTSERFQKDKKYWEDLFENIPNIATIPGSKKSNIDITNINANRLTYTLNNSIVIKIKEYCKENNISLYNFFMAIYSIYISEISNLKDFVIDTPILNRTNKQEKNTAGMFVNIIPFRINLENIKDIKSLLKYISSNSLQILKHQKYSYQCLLKNLREKNKNIPNLYNILFSYQITNAHQNSDNVKYRTEWTFNGCCSEDLDIQIFDLNDTGNLTVSYDYKTNIYKKIDIENIHKRILNMIQKIISFENINLEDIEIVTPGEKNQLLNNFNNTSLNYNYKRTIIKLFEEQAEKTPSKIALVANNQSLTYKELNEKANMLATKLLSSNIQPNDIIGIMINRSLEMVIGLLAILKCGATYLPIDPQYPIDRISYMIENSETKLILVNSKTINLVPQNCAKINIDLSNSEIYNNSNIIKNISNIQNPNSLAYLIYTSGSTGKPKGVQITNKNLCNFVNGIKQLIKFDENQTMVSVTTICFDIFGLEIWCSLSSGSTLVIANENEQNSPSLLNKLCLENSVNIIQTTPSRYSTIFEEKENLEFLKNITHILVGGESLNKKLLTTMKKLSSAKIFNMYGPTETTIWSTVKELSTEDFITVGKPISNTQCYILNSNHKLLPINTPGELYIGGDGVTNGYLKRDELTKEKFIDSPFKKGEKIYNTNDLAYYNKNGDIVHLGRTDFQVKIRGFRVELEEIEFAISSQENINQCIVVMKKLANNHDALIAYYTIKNNENISELNNRLKNVLGQTLPQYMIPNYFIKIDKMPYTQNNKIDRKALPEPNVKEKIKNIIPPRNDLDKEIIKIIKKILNLHEVSLSDTLLELGGDSLTAITFSTKILVNFNVQMDIRDILSNYSIQDISDFIKENQSKGHSRIKIEKTPIQCSYPLSSAQKRIYYNTKMIGENNTVYNLPGGILVEGLLDPIKVKKIFYKILERHSSLRTYFVLEDNNVTQKILDKISFDIPVYYNTENEFNNILKKFSKPFSLDNDTPLIRAEIHYLDNKKTLLLVESHHIVMDGTGLNNLIIEFNRLYNGENLKSIPIQYKDYAVWENNYINSPSIEKSENYWVNKFSGSDFSELNLPYDYKPTNYMNYQGNKLTKIIDEKYFRKIERFAKKIGVSPYMLFLSVFFILLYKYTGQDSINIGSPIANRDLNETKRMIGMFVNNIVIQGKINSDSSFNEFLSNIKQQVLNDLSHQPYPFDMLIKKLGIIVDNSKNPLFDVMFTYQNKEENIIKLDNEECKIIEIDTNISKFNLSLEIKPKDHIINIEYRTDLFKLQTIERLFEHYMNTLKSIIDDINIKIKDISIISDEEKNKILNEFNETKIEYPKNKTVIQLFEEQVEKTPNKIAVVFENQKLTYSELNEKANQLAHYLKNESLDSEDVVSILLDKSLEMLVAILAILKIGCTYLPIDISYPAERKEYILKDSNSKLLLTSRKLNIEPNLLVKSLYIDLDTQNIYSSENKQNLNYFGKNTDLAYIMYTSGSTGKPKGVMIENKSIIRLVKNTNYIKFNEDDKILQTGSIVFDACTFEIWGALLNGLELYIIKKEELLDASSLHKYILNNKISILWLTAPLFNQLCEENPHMFNTVRCVLSGGDVLSCKHINMARTANPNLTLINGYGPTENTTFSCCHRIDKKYTNSIPIGKPIANSTGYIISKDGNLQPIGIPGELWVGGDGVARGYLNNPSLTNEKFIDNPFEYGKLYKTGDLTKWNYDGTIDFLGRIDDQIKLRGFRVELSEITSIISDYDGIKEAFSILKQIKNEKSICTYIVSNTIIDIENFKKYLSKFLPQYMIPKYIIQINKLPKNQNGKIDKNKLPEINISNQQTRNIVLPTNDLEQKIYNIFKKVLQLDDLSIEDNFFEFGGDSINAMKLQIEALKINLDITYGDIFNYPSVKEMANFLIKNNKIENSNKSNDYFKYDKLINNNTLDNLDNINLQYTPIGNILLTGVTGFLGAHILDSYLKQETGTVYCLIRGKNHTSALERLQNTLHFYFKDKYDKYIGSRIKCIEGDITLNLFGISEEQYIELGKDISTVIHSAALVKHFGNYSEFEQINVNGTKKIIEFCEKFNTRLMHISTISVSGNNFAEGSYVENNIKEDILYGENKFYIGQNLENLYVRSKFLAEKAVLDAISNGLEAYILRMGNLTSRFSEGKFQQNHLENAFVNRVKTFLQLECIPDYMMNGYVEFTPIDYSGDAIIKIANHYDKNFSILHLLNNKHLFLTNFYDILNELGIKLRILSSDDFSKLVDNMLKDDNKSNILQGIIRDFNSDKKLIYESNIKIQSEFTNQFLKKLDFDWPTIDKNYIKKYLEYLIEIGYLNLKLKED